MKPLKKVENFSGWFEFWGHSIEDLQLSSFEVFEDNVFKVVINS